MRALYYLLLCTLVPSTIGGIDPKTQIQTFNGTLAIVNVDFANKTTQYQLAAFQLTDLVTSLADGKIKDLPVSQGISTAPRLFHHTHTRHRTCVLQYARRLVGLHTEPPLCKCAGMLSRSVSATGRHRLRHCASVPVCCQGQ